MTRKYSSISIATALSAGISNSQTTITVVTGTGAALLGGVTLAAGNVDQFTLAIDPDTNNEEIVFATAVSADTFTVVRGRAGSSAISHASGAPVKHVLTSDDLTWFESNTSPLVSMGFKGATSGTTTLQANSVAGGTLNLPTATDTLVGKATIDTLTNKTLTSPVLNTPTINDAKQNLSLNAQTGITYTFVLADNGKLVTLDNASAITVTVPTNASVAYATGAIINLQQIGAGQVTVAPASGVTINGTGTKTRAQWSAASLVKTATDTWTLIGDLA